MGKREIGKPRGLIFHFVPDTGLNASKDLEQVIKKLGINRLTFHRLEKLLNLYLMRVYINRTNSESAHTWF